MQKLCFDRECTISGYRTLEKCFATNAPNLLHSTQNDVSECFGTFCKPLTQKIMQILCFEPSCTISGYRTSEKSFATNTSNVLNQTKNEVLVCFEAFCKPSARKTRQNLCFGHECTISRYRTSVKSFATKASNVLH